MNMFLLLALGSISLVLPSIRGMIFTGAAGVLYVVGGIIRRIFGTVPGWYTRLANAVDAAVTGTINWLVTIAWFVGCTFAGLVVLNVLAIKLGSGWFFWAEYAVMGTICFALFMVSRIRDHKWFAAATLVFYGLAVLGVVFPSVVKVYPTLFVIGMFLVPMIKVFKEACPRLGLALGGLAMAVLLSVIAFNYVGVIKLGVNRVRLDNALVVGQANAEDDFNVKAEEAINDTVEGIAATLGKEMASGDPNPHAADADLTKLGKQKATKAVMRSVNPVTNSQPTSGRWLPRLRQKTLVGLLLLLVVVALAWPKKSGLASLTTH